MLDYYNGPPGITAGRSTAARVIFLQRSEMFLAGGRTIDGTKSRDPGNTPDIGVLRPGLLMGKITSGGLYAPAILGVLTNAEAGGATALEVSAAVATEIARRQAGTFKLTGPPSANGVVVTETVTYSAIDTTTGVITATALASAFVAGSFIQPTDGSETPRTFLPDWDYGIKVVDSDGSSYTTVDFPKLPVSGIVDSSQLLPAWPSDTSLQAWIVARLNDSFGGQYIFDHKF